MNERIKELLDEACEYAHSKHFAHVKKFKYVTPDQHANAQDTMQEKFAELIVGQCAKHAEHAKGIDVNFETYFKAMIFGVEE